MGIIQNNQIREIFEKLSKEKTGFFYAYSDLADEVTRRKPSIKPSQQQLVRLSMEFNVKRVKVYTEKTYVTRIAFYPRGVDLDSLG